MHLNVIAVGTRMPGWVDKAWDDYSRRMPRECRLRLKQVPTARRGGGPAEEGENILGKIGERDLVIALEIDANQWSTEQLAQQLNGWLQGGRDVSFLIGGADGLSDRCRERAQLRWSLSPLTFPHALVRVLVAEQLYRAWSILHNHPYHR